MDDAAEMGVVDRSRQGFEQLGGLSCRQGSVRQTASERAAVDKLQREVRMAAILAHLVDLHDVGMLQSGHGLRLGPEARQFVAAGMSAGEDHLEGDDAPQARLPSAVDDAHASPTQLIQQLITGHARHAGPGKCTGQGFARSRHLRVCQPGLPGFHDDLRRGFLPRGGVNGRRGKRGEKEVVQVEQAFQLWAEVGEALLILLQLGRFSPFFAEEDFALDQVEEQFSVGLERGLSLQIFLHRDAVSTLPALPLVDPQYGQQLQRHHGVRLSEKCMYVRLVAGRHSRQNRWAGGPSLSDRVAGGGGLLTVYLVQAHLFEHAVDGPFEPLAQRLGTVADLGGDLGPIASPGALVGEKQFVRAQSAARSRSISSPATI